MPHQRTSPRLFAPMFDRRPEVRRDRLPRPPGRSPRVDRYRFFMAGVFCCVVLVDTWADRTLSAHLSGDVIGPGSIAIWALTLLGAGGMGPMGVLRSAMRG